MQNDKIIKYIKGSLSKDERILLEEWIIATSENTKKYHSIKTEYITSKLKVDPNYKNTEKLYKSFKNEQDKNKIKPLYYLKEISKYAAILIVLISLSYVYFHSNNKIKTLPKDAIVLQLENGDIQVVKENNEKAIVNANGKIVANQSQKELIYKKNTSLKLIYNTLTVPYGKRFNLSLSDGTKIYLNSGTSIKYPTSFVKGKNREVYIIGEASFKVAKDKDHPFIVNTKHLNVRVFGTEFIVSSYPEDKETNAVLLEGSVGVYSNDKSFNKAHSKFLVPGQKASQKESSSTIVIEDVDVDLYAAWTKGKIIFKHLPFTAIAKKLERHYNVKITNTNKTLNKEYFTASFDTETIEQVMDVFKKNYGLNYTIKNNQITIN